LRYSDDLQNPRSIADQERECRAFAAARGLVVAAVFSDAAISGADTGRPGYQAMLAAARAGGFAVLVAEALNRIGRNLAEQAAMYQRMTFYGARIVTIAEGEIGLVHVGLKGTMNELQLVDMKLQVRRGQRGNVETGRAAGGLGYGYRVVRRLDARGELERGLREIDPAQAAVVLRIFRAYDAGQSAKRIAIALNRDGILSPRAAREGKLSPAREGHSGKNTASREDTGRGPLWQPSTISGHAARGFGILVNEIYAGVRIYNRTRQERDPDSGRYVERVNPADQWVRVAAPELAIVPPDLWARVQARRLALGRAPLATRRGPKHLLSALVRCGACGGAMTVYTTDRLACAARRVGGCANPRTLTLSRLTRRVLDGLTTRLLADPAPLRAFVDEWRSLEAAAEAARAAASRRAAPERTDVGRRIGRLTAAIAAAGHSPALLAELAALEQRLAEIAPHSEEPAAERNKRSKVIRLPHDPARLYRQAVADLAGRLGDAAARPAAQAGLRMLIERIEVAPAPARTVTLHARAAAVFALATGLAAPEMLVSLASPGGRPSCQPFPALAIAV
jgi:DNA invertase Pin-like site-specific DNA recombinase